MAAKPVLRAVEPGEKPARRKKTVQEAATSGDRLDLLIAMRDRIAKAVTSDDCPPRDLAALTKRLDDIADKIAVLEAVEERDGDDGPAEDEAFDASAI